jgi:internalin A
MTNTPMATDSQNEAIKRIQEALSTGAVTLNLSGLELTEVPEAIAQLTNLQTLDLRNNQLTSVPEAIAQLTSLTTLNLHNNQLASLPDIITNLISLKELVVKNNQLTSLQDSIEKLINLQRLSLSQNQLMSIPDSIGRLIKLQILSLGNNNFSEFPRSITQLTNLKLLALGKNQIKNISVNNLIGIQTLALNDNQLKYLPDEISQLQDLQELYLNNNEIQSLPEDINQNKSIKKFFASRNKLISIPKALCYLDDLEELHISGNLLTRLPEEIGNLRKLRKLYLSRNNLTHIPNSILNISSLERLSLYYNDNLGLPPEILDFSPQKILDYYFRTRQGEKRPLNEAKLIFVGYGAVGKTSLVNRLVNNIFDRDSSQTEGIQITQWPIRLNNFENVKLNIWDFGGQEIMHATHQFFLTQRSLYILVLNGRQGHEDADTEYWLNLIESFGKESPVLIILNRIESHAFDLNRRALRQKFPNIVDFINTDCKTGYGIDTLRQTIERETNRLKHLRDAFPASWFGIKDQLATMPENFISFEHYRTLCNSQGETNPQAQNDLAIYLHSLGIVLNYKDDPRLRDTHILNPHWITKGIYTILNANTLTQSKGEINVSDFATILDPIAYPPERHTYLFELMRKFELCFRFPEDEGRYLIPQLLDKQQPPEADTFEPTECLNFQYHYPILPEGLLPRFIVRTYSHSTSQPRWRTGVILSFEGDTALVKADIQDKKVYILVKGSSSGRRRLLAVIRSDFERIHSDFSFTPQEIVPVPNHPEVLISYKKLRIMEKNNIPTIQEVIDEDVLNLNVAELLNGVDLEGTRKPETIHNPNKKALRLFYSYSHKDEALRDELETHLKLLQRQSLIESWHDRRIAPGQEWKGEIDSNLERADIILLLISADFIASDYCYDIEMTRALERYAAKKAEVIPIILRDCSWHSAPFGKLQALPKDAKAVTNKDAWYSHDPAWTDVERGIATVIKQWKRDRLS